MTAREYLKQYRFIVAEVTQRRIIIKRMKQELFKKPTDKITAAIDEVIGKTMPESHWSPEDLAAYKKQIKEQEESISRFRKYMIKVVNQISGLEEADHRTILFARYITLLNWDEIAEEIHYDDEYARKKLHQTALQAFTKKFSGEFYKVVPKNTQKSAS